MRKIVSAVLVPIDDFTDEIIKKEKVNIQVVNDYASIVRKDDGFIVLTNLSKDNVNIKINSYSYNDAEIKINMAKINRLNPVVKIRLKPGKYYKFAQGITCLSGMAAKNSRLTIIMNNSSNIFRLLEDNKKNSENIKIYNPLNIDIEGRSFIIREKKSRIHEQFTVIGYDETNEYSIMDNCLSKAYKKESCEIIKVDYVNTDDYGSFFIPLKNVTDAQNEVIIETDKKDKFNIKLEAGSINNINCLK